MSNLNRKTNKNTIPYASRRDVALIVTFGCINLVFLAASVLIYIMTRETGEPVRIIFPILFSVAFVAIYSFEVALIYIARYSKTTMLPKANIYDLLMEDGSVILKNTTLPVVVFHIRLEILRQNYLL